MVWAALEGLYCNDIRMLGRGGRGGHSCSGSLLSAGSSLLRGLENDEVPTISYGTLKHSDNFTRFEELRSWDPTNFLML